MRIINVAVIAHVDHGKTTLVDAILKQTDTFRSNQAEMQQTTILDRNELERERGITIIAKNCAVMYKGVKINIIDTPGHADFSGEVERTLGMADGAILIVDAQEGPMPQTRFVLKKAISSGLKIIVVINKIDKQFAKPQEALRNVESLFLELANDESYLDFPVLYAIGKRGVVFNQIPTNLEQEGNVYPLLDAILDNVPYVSEKTGVFKMVVTSLDYDAYLGRLVIGRVYQGKIQKGMKIINTKFANSISKVENLFVYQGLDKVEAEEAQTGEIVCFSGVGQVSIGDTVSDPSDCVSLPGVSVGEPTLHMTIGPNTSPFSGKEGKYTTSRQLEERLEKELESNLSLRLEKLGNGKFVISGRGELHLSVLLETLRREGYEMEVGKPEVIVKQIDGVLKEPVEEVLIIVPSEFVGVVSEELGRRYASLVNMQTINEYETEFVYKAPTRVLIGLKSALLTATKGTVVYSSTLMGYEPLGKTLPRLRKGVLIADRAGEALAYGLENAQERGVTFINPGEQVYEGMIIGSNAKDEDILINVTKGKKLTNMRSKSSDGIIQLTPATKFSLEQCLDFLESDELLEITPLSLRLRKKYLTEAERRKMQRQIEQ
ncbi:MAG: GTP-binding protein [Patescibacteria group bacterium]|nr:GTP-binding protein [Patescibacteria group bacterium]